MAMSRKSEVVAVEMVSALNTAMSRLRTIWEVIGIPEDQRMERTRVVKKYIEGLLSDMIGEEEALQKRLESSVAKNSEEVAHLCQDLDLPPFKADKGASLLQTEKDLRTKASGLWVERRTRLQRHKDLRHGLERLALCLGTRPSSDLDRSGPGSLPHGTTSSVDSILNCPSPSLSYLAEMEKELQKIEEEKSRREAVVLSLRKQINGILIELEEKPDDGMEVETTVECGLTNDDLQRLKDSTERLEQRLAEVESSCATLRTRLCELWTQLDVGEDERASTATRTAGTSERVRKLLEDEVGRLTEMRRAHLGDVISRVKQGIVQEWERCCYGDSQKQAFVPFHDDYVSEERLSNLEQELERLKSEFDAGQDLYLGLARWDRMWQQFTEMERRAGDPARLTNRGGALLREEQERKCLKRELPKLESELSALLVGRAIFPWGKPFPELVACCWATLKEEREKEKQERQLKRAQTLENEVVFGTFPRTPGKRRGGNATTPGKHRKMNGTAGVSATPNSSCLRSPVSIYTTPQTRRAPLTPKSMRHHPRPPLGDYNPPGSFPRCAGKRQLEIGKVKGTADAADGCSPWTNAALIVGTESYADFTRALNNKPCGRENVLNSTRDKI
uniref:protein regulator of cytokinesis 1-like isoform X1 n=2 Tax=Myxine glutinosa TaxID=7769 RepID=UPI00358FC482